MATRKSASKGRKSAPAKSAAARGPLPPYGVAIRTGALPPYGVAIRDAIARGDAAEQKRVAAAARKHLSDVKAALAKLDKALGK
jgi:hypothetical protein